MAAGSLADWLAALASLVTAGIAAWVGLRTYEQQRTSSDVKLALEIFETINRYWDRLVDSGHPRYEHGQILSQFELAATLFNNRTLSPKALPILENHIIEVFNSYKSSEDGQQLIRELKTSNHTFAELEKFLADHVRELRVESMATAPAAKAVRWRMLGEVVRRPGRWFISLIGNGSLTARWARLRARS
jgi:hypothetical protein